MPNWIKTIEHLPENDFPVLIYVIKPDMRNYSRRLRAIYARKYTLPVSTDHDEFGEYNDETDQYYCPEGWYENNEFDEINWAVEGVVTHWMYLPDPPAKHECEQVKNYDNITDMMNWKKP